MKRVIGVAAFLAALLALACCLFSVWHLYGYTAAEAGTAEAVRWQALGWASGISTVFLIIVAAVAAAADREDRWEDRRIEHRRIKVDETYIDRRWPAPPAPEGTS